MRAVIEFTPIKDSVIDYNYQYYVASAIYRSLGNINESLAATLHKQTTPKLYTFSWIQGRAVPTDKGLLLKEGEKYRIYVSSPLKEIVSSVISAFLVEKKIKIDKLYGKITDIKILKTPRFDYSATFYTLSPILVRGYSEHKKNPHVDLEPTDENFFEAVKKNLLKKYELFYGKKARGFEVVEVGRIRKKRIKIKDTYNTAWLMRMKVVGVPSVLTFAYEAGLGERTAMGFGMVEAWREKGVAR